MCVCVCVNTDMRCNIACCKHQLLKNSLAWCEQKAPSKKPVITICFLQEAKMSSTCELLTVTVKSVTLKAL